MPFRCTSQLPQFPRRLPASTMAIRIAFAGGLAAWAEPAMVALTGLAVNDIYKN